MAVIRRGSWALARLLHSLNIHPFCRTTYVAAVQPVAVTLGDGRVWQPRINGVFPARRIHEPRWLV